MKDNYRSIYYLYLVIYQNKCVQKSKFISTGRQKMFESIYS